MSVAPFLRSLVPLIIGLAVGGAGVWMFADSMPRPGGSAEERVEQLERELKKTREKLAALEAEELRRQQARVGVNPDNLRRSVADGARIVMQDLRDGKPVNVNDLFRAGKPFLRDLAPLFDRIRIKEQRKRVDSMTGELARKYGLNQEQQLQLKRWFDGQSEAAARRWSDMLGREDTGLEEVIRATRDVRLDEGLESFMSGVLPAEQFKAFKSERMGQRAEQVQREADMMVQRLDSLVGLEQSQRNQVFAVMVRGSRDYDPSMVIEDGGAQISSSPVTNKREALLEILNPDQRATYDAELRKRREEAEKDMNSVGLSLPQNWEMLSEGNW